MSKSQQITFRICSDEFLYSYFKRMNKLPFVVSVTFFLLVFSFAFLIAQPVKAETACTVSVSPSSIKGGSTTTVNFTVQNLSDTDDISDISISTTAVDEFQIQSASSSGWSGSIDSSNHASFSGGVISTGGSQSFSLSLAAIDQDQATIGWDVYEIGRASCRERV